MAASEPPPDEQPPPQNPPLPYKKWVLKVSIHCQACKRKVKKVLQSIEGVYIIDVDEKQHKVTVTGNVEADALIKKLIRSGKNAEMWQDNKSSFKDKKSGNLKNTDPKLPDGAKSNENSDDDDDDDEEDKPGEKQGTPKSGGPSVRFDVPPPGNAPAGAPAGQGPPKKKKKKKKKKSSSAAAPAGSNNAPPANATPEGLKMGGGPPPHAVDQGNLGHQYPPPPHPHQFPPSFAPQQAYVVSYNAALHPAAGGAPSYYYAPSSPYTYAYTRAEVHSMRCRPLDSFEILSDENPNACYIM